MRCYSLSTRLIGKHLRVGMFAAKLLEAPLPWTKMRGVRALIGLARRFGAERLDAACARALAADMLSVHRLARMSCRCSTSA